MPNFVGSAEVRTPWMEGSIETNDFYCRDIFASRIEKVFMQRVWDLIATYDGADITYEYDWQFLAYQAIKDVPIAIDLSFRFRPNSWDHIQKDADKIKVLIDTMASRYGVTIESFTESSEHRSPFTCIPLGGGIRISGNENVIPAMYWTLWGARDPHEFAVDSGNIRFTSSAYQTTWKHALAGKEWNAKRMIAYYAGPDKAYRFYGKGSPYTRYRSLFREFKAMRKKYPNTYKAIKNGDFVRALEG